MRLVKRGHIAVDRNARLKDEPAHKSLPFSSLHFDPATRPNSSPAEQNGDETMTLERRAIRRLAVRGQNGSTGRSSTGPRRRRDDWSSASRTSCRRAWFRSTNRRCSAIGKTPSEWSSRCGSYGTRICRCCSSSGQIRSPHTWPPLRRPTTAFERRWSKLRADETVLARVIVVGDDIAGTIGSWGDAGEREVTYWIGRSYWGKGLRPMPSRPSWPSIGRGRSTPASHPTTSRRFGFSRSAAST